MENSPAAPSSKTFKCEEEDCGKTFPSRMLLRLHFRTHETNVDFYYCEWCESRFTFKTSLISHKRIHFPEKRHACSQCNELFPSSRQLFVHKRKHSRQEFITNPIPCPNCNKVFSNQQSLDLHTRRIHELVKPFACDMCENAYATKPELEQHRRRHTGEKPILCTVCNKGYASYNGMRQHRLKFHETEAPPIKKRKRWNPSTQTFEIYGKENQFPAASDYTHMQQTEYSEIDIDESDEIGGYAEYNAVYSTVESSVSEYPNIKKEKIDTEDEEELEKSFKDLEKSLIEMGEGSPASSTPKKNSLEKLRTNIIFFPCCDCEAICDTFSELEKHISECHAPPSIMLTNMPNDKRDRTILLEPVSEEILRKITVSDHCTTRKCSARKSTSSMLKKKNKNLKTSGNETLSRVETEKPIGRSVKLEADATPLAVQDQNKITDTKENIQREWRPETNVSENSEAGDSRKLACKKKMRSFRCDKCVDWFSTEEKLKMHQQDKHSLDLLDESLYFSNVRKTRRHSCYMCDECVETFLTEEKLKQHKTDRHSEKTVDGREGTANENRCGVCQKKIACIRSDMRIYSSHDNYMDMCANCERNYFKSIEKSEGSKRKRPRKPSESSDCNDTDDVKKEARSTECKKSGTAGESQSIKPEENQILKCSQCQNPLDDYNPQMRIYVSDEDSYVDVCPECEPDYLESFYRKLSSSPDPDPDAHKKPSREKSPEPPTSHVDCDDCKTRAESYKLVREKVCGVCAKPIAWDGIPNDPTSNHADFCSSCLKRPPPSLPSCWLGESPASETQIDKPATVKRTATAKFKNSKNSSNVHECPTCNKKFTAISYLLNHEEVFHNRRRKKQFVCVECAKSYSSADSLSKHKCEKFEEIVRCLRCGKKFKSQWDLVCHRVNEHIASPYACEICGERLHKLREFVAHKKQHCGE